MKRIGRLPNELKLPLLALSATVLIGAALVSWSHSRILGAQRTLAAQENQLRETMNRFRRSGDERDLIVRYAKPYQDLRNQGLIGPEQRINWLDALRNANQQTKLFGLEYQINAQQAYARAQEFNAPALGMAQSVMTLSLRLAHEGELPRFLRLLEAQQAGVFDISECTLERITSADAPLRAQANIRAECKLAWITLNPESIERRP